MFVTPHAGYLIALQRSGHKPVEGVGCSFIMAGPVINRLEQ